MLLVAGLREGITLAPVAGAADLARTADEVDARLVVAAEPGSGLACPGPAGRPPAPRGPAVLAGADLLRRPHGPPTPAARLLLQTSGTTGARRWIALSDANVMAVVDSHVPLLDLDGAIVLSVLPWHHAFGLVVELLPALLAGAAVVRDPAGGRDPDALLRLAREHRATHLDAVPHTLRLLVAHPGGPALVAGLRGGVVGGAPIDHALAAALTLTRLRVGYGQTEASPGIALGDPGAWRAGTLGRPLGCAVRIDDDGVLAFRGPNACLGRWEQGALVPLDPSRWARTGDLARAEADGSYIFEGRAADSFKLANGRWVAAAAVERAVCARFPAVGEALLSSDDGRDLVLACSPAAGHAAAALPAAAEVAPLLGPLTSRPLRVVAVAPDAWVRTPKGELDRRHPTGGARG
jgi:long-subunit acyl-CoA synthetase (AMP-forming)